MNKLIPMLYKDKIKSKMSFTVKNKFEINSLLYTNNIYKIVYRKKIFNNTIFEILQSQKILIININICRSIIYYICAKINFNS